MPEEKKALLVFGARVTAPEAEKYLDALAVFIADLEEGILAEIDATQTKVIDSAGCQLIDMAILAAENRSVRLTHKLSEPVKKALKELGLRQEVMRA